MANRETTTTGPRFRDLPAFPRAHYEISIEWCDLEDYIQRNRGGKAMLVLEPDYQRGHVWSEAQQIAFVEYGLMGGENSMVITTNCPGWMVDFRGPYELVDGLQRVTAVLRWQRHEIKAFGHYMREYADRPGMDRGTFRWRVGNLSTRAEVLNLYLLLNAGGVVHSPEEISRVRGLLEKETKR
jgi:hypothetical protein